MDRNEAKDVVDYLVLTIQEMDGQFSWYLVIFPIRKDNNIEHQTEMYNK